jgi:hypothetical protein
MLKTVTSYYNISGGPLRNLRGNYGMISPLKVATQGRHSRSPLKVATISDNEH